MNFKDVLVFLNSPKVYIPIIVICVTILLISISSRYINKLFTKELSAVDRKRKNTMVATVKHIVRYVIIIFALLITLSLFGVDVTGILASLGITGVIAGLALQDALKDIIMGVNIIVDNFYIIGDYVTYNNFTGEVIEFNLKTTKIKHEDGTVLVVSNRNISQVHNLSQQSAGIITTFKVANSVSEDKVYKIVESILKQINELELSTKESEYLGIQKLNNNTEYAIKSYCRSGSKLKLNSSILSITKKEFAKNKIDIQA